VPQVPSAHFTSDIPTYVEQGCTATSQALVVVPRPTVRKVFPRVMCRGTTQRVVVEGKHLIFITPAAAAERKRQMGNSTTGGITGTTGAGTTGAGTTGTGS